MYEAIVFKNWAIGSIGSQSLGEGKHLKWAPQSPWLLTTTTLLITLYPFSPSTFIYSICNYQKLWYMCVFGNYLLSFSLEFEFLRARSLSILEASFQHLGQYLTHHRAHERLGEWNPSQSEPPGSVMCETGTGIHTYSFYSPCSKMKYAKALYNDVSWPRRKLWEQIHTQTHGLLMIAWSINA